jgi:CHAT domain-containing protein
MSLRLLLLWSLLFAAVLGSGLVQAVGPPARLNREQRKRLAGAKHLLVEIGQSFQAGKHAEGVKALQTLLAIQREVHGSVSTQSAAILHQLGTVEERKGNFVSARKWWAERLAILQPLYGEGDWRVTESRLDLEEGNRLARLDNRQRARLLRAERLHEEGARFFREGANAQAIEVARTALTIRKEILGDRHRASVLSLANLGVFLAAGGELRQGIETLERALALSRKILGEHHPDHIVRLSNLGYFCMQAGELARARPLLEQAAFLTAKLMGKDHPTYPHRLAAVAQIHLRLSDHARAKPLLEKVLRIIKASQGEGTATQATLLTDLASVHVASREYAKAQLLYEKALLIYKSKVGEKHPAYAVALNNLAFAFQASGQHGKALALMEKVLAIKKQTVGEKSNSYATSLHNLAAIHEQRGDLAKARALYEKARDICKEAVGELHPDHATSLERLGELYERLGENAKAVASFRKIVTIHKAAVGEQSVRYTAALTRLATLYAAAGDYAHCQPLFEKALKITGSLRGVRHIDYGRALHNLAEISRAVHDWSEAAALYQKAFAIKKEALGERHPDCAMTLSSLGAMYREMDDLDSAQKYLEQARDITRAALGAKHPEHAKRLNSLAVLLMSRKEYAKARTLLEEAVSILKATLGERNADYLDALDNLGDLFLETGDSRRARPIYEKTLALRKAVWGESHPDYALTLRQRGRLHLAEGEHAKAAAALAQALRIKQRYADVTSGVLNQRQSLTVRIDLRDLLSDYLTAALAADVPVEQMHEAVLLTKGSVADRHAAELLARDEPELASLLERLRLVRAGMARLQAEPAPGAAMEWEKRFRELELQRDSLEADLTRRSARFRQQRKVSSELLRKALPERTALVDLLVYDHYVLAADKKNQVTERRLLAFVVRAGQKTALCSLGKAAPIHEAVAAWHKPFQAAPPGRVDEKAADNLRRLVWQPLQKFLPKGETILVSPDGPLCALPLAALPGSKPGTYLIEERRIASVASPRQLLEQRTWSKDQAEGLLAVGGLAYGSPRSKEESLPQWPPLPGTRFEAERITSLYRQRFPKAPPRLLTGAAGDKGRLLQELSATKDKRPRYLHLATHGFLLQPQTDKGKFKARAYLLAVRNPLLLSGIVLASANRDPGGILTAEEVSGLDLRGCDLVVLSACETGLGTFHATEGVLGLQRAFHLAGARTTVASLWSVSDPATSVLMEQFYRNLLGAKKVAKLEALRQAQLFVLRNPDKVVARARELQKALAGSGEEIGLRGVGKKAGLLPVGGRKEDRRSPPAWWAAFVLSGESGVGQR